MSSPNWRNGSATVFITSRLILAVIAFLAVLSIRVSLRRLRAVAAEISQGRIGDDAFVHRNTVPELSSVARDFDKLVHELRRVSQQIRQSAEDKAHSLKTPLATIRSALEPVPSIWTVVGDCGASLTMAMAPTVWPSWPGVKVRAFSS